MYLCGLDLGQAQDYTALCVVSYGERPARYDVVELRRFALGTPYPTIVRQVKALLETPVLCGVCPLVIDGTGCGRPVVDVFRHAGLSRVCAVSIHGGDTVSRDGGDYRVPKRDLVGVMQLLLQQRRLRIAEALPDAVTLQRELLAFRVTIDPRTAHDSYAAWREKDHDDLVLAVSLACWMGEHTPLPAEILELSY